jgi:glucosamine 6-phosphate synthetase-like amidotransferase/phosphosugar isomerase protein
MYLGSDAMALAKLTTKVIYLEEGDWAILTPKPTRYMTGMTIELIVK